ncbi:MAG: DUF167 domain-containing protein [Bacteroidota bacterium]
MKISIRVKTNARKNEVLQIEPGKYLVSVTASPIEGKANAKIIEALSEYFDKPKRCFTIIRGEKGKEKVIEIV